MSIQPFLYIPLFCLSLVACSTKKTELTWSKSFNKIGSQSSPKATDLNQDGILDIIMGAGENEYQASNKGIIALNGVDGQILWEHPCTDQVYGSATLLDVTNDGIEDVFIGGRSNQFYAINGATGESIWQWNYDYENDSVLKYAKYNFQNAVTIPDQNDDGLEDLLVVTGGNAKAEPNTMKNRFPGVLMILSSSDGKIIAADSMPDGMESYMTPLYFEQPDGSQNIVFATGGETINGRLYKASLTSLKNNNISSAKVIAKDTSGHGFIAPSVAVDFNNDGFLDVAAISHGSYIFCIDGKTNKSLWQKNIPNTESSNGFALGNFNQDDTPDLFTFVSEGVWPESKGSVQIMLDGKTGETLYQNNLGCTGFSSPVIYDINDDGIDEAIISINEYDCDQGFVGSGKLDVTTRLVALDFRTKTVQTIDELKRFKNIFSTPYIGDIDNDGYLDIVHCQYFSPNADLLSFLGMQVKRISTSIKLNKPVAWGEYMGPKGKGVFR